MNKQKYKKYLERKINESRNKLFKLINEKLDLEKERIWKEWEEWADKNYNLN